MTDEPRTEWVDLREVAKELGVDRRLLITLAERGEFPEVLMLGPRIRKVRRDLYRIWLERNVIGPNPPSPEPIRKPAHFRETSGRGRQPRANAN